MEYIRLLQHLENMEENESGLLQQTNRQAGFPRFVGSKLVIKCDSFQDVYLKTSTLRILRNIVHISRDT